MRLRSSCLVACLMWCVHAFLHCAEAQTYISAVGNPSFGVNLPIPNGYINIANGNLHMEIPLATLKQRGALQLNERLVYDSRIWEIVEYNNYYWWPINVPNSQAGWRFVKGNETGTLGVASSLSQQLSCTGTQGGTLNATASTSTVAPDQSLPTYYYYSASTYYNWTDPAGTVHTFDTPWTYTQQRPSQCAGGNRPAPPSNTVTGYAIDATGYQISMSGVPTGGASTIKVLDSTGTQVYPQVIDRFGNYWTNDSSGDLIDDLGRVPVITTVNGTTTYYDVLSPNGPISNNGTRVRYTVTSEQIPISTAFDESGVVEYQNNGDPPGSVSQTIPAIRSIALPDGSSYQFTYDSYGEIQSVTLPTGGVVNYGWSNYTDSYNNVNRWLSQSTIAGSSTLYTPSVITQCSSNGTGCQEQVNVHRPSGDETVYTLTLDNGAWDTNTTVYAGAASANQAKSTSVSTYNFSIACAAAICNGAEDVTKSVEVDSLPDANLSSQTQIAYANPKTGQMTTLDQWDFYATGSTPTSIPTRQANYGYTNFDLTSESHFNSQGQVASSATYTYTTTATATSGIVGHGTANAGGPYLTSVTTNNNAPIQLLTTSSTYDDTGALLTTQDANQNPVTTYHYDPTHTFVTEVDRPSTVSNGTTFQHVTKASFDPNSGAILTSDDENSVANGQAYQVKYTYEPVAGRLQQITYPKAVPAAASGSSVTYAYPSPNEVDTTVPQSANVSVMTATIVDGYGRASQTTSNSITSTQTYDGNGRPYSVTNPTSGSATTNGTTYTYYDALNRISSVVFPDGNSRSMQVTGNTALMTDELGNQSEQVFDAFGELTSVIEADPNTGALALQTNYTYDGLGNVTCVEQHGNVSGTGCGSPTSSDATSAWRVRRFFYNSLSQLRAASIPEHTSISASVPASQNCGAGTPWTATDCYFYDNNGNQTSIVDNRGVTRTYNYDALNRPTLKTSPNGTRQDLWYDGGQNGVGYLWHQSNDYNAAATYGYDALGREVSEASCRPSNCASAYVTASATYDLAGNRTSVTYPDGRVMQSNYDVLNRLSSVVYQQWAATTVGSTYWSATSYTAPGLLQSASYGSGTNAVQMNASFNSRLSMTSVSYQTASSGTTQTLFSENLHWDKNAANLLSETYPSYTRQSSYDKLNRLISSEDIATGSSSGSTAIVTLSGAEGSHQVCTNAATQSASPNAVAPPQPGPTCHTVYDTGTVSLTIGTYKVSAPYGAGSTQSTIASALVSQLNEPGSPVTATSATAANGTSMIVAMSSVGSGAATDYPLSTTGGDFTLSWTGSGMTGGSNGTAIAGGVNQQYTLDAWGNLTSMGSSGFNQPVNLQNQVSTYLYDAAGRLATDANLSYTYDDDGLLLTSSNGATYVYDALGQRAQVAQGGTAKEYYYFAGQLIATLNPALGSSGWTDYIYAETQKIAVVPGNQAAAPVYSLPDQIGSEVGTVNSNGTLASTLAYTPFGQVLSGNGTDAFLFAGLERDPSGLDHAGFRQYSSATGRWTTPDPYDGSYLASDPQSLNRYVYARNNPLASIDPSGLQNGDPLPPEECDWECEAVDLFVDAGVDLFRDLFGGSDFHGNVKATHGPGLQNRVNADGSINYGPEGPDGSASGYDFSGYFRGVYFSHGDPAPSKVCNNAADVAFVKNNYPTVAKLAKPYNASAVDILGLAANESGYGTGRFAVQGNAFFNLEVTLRSGTPSSLPRYANGFLSATSAPQTFVFTYPSFTDSVRGFLSGYGNTISGITDPSKFLQALKGAGFNTATSSFTSAGVINAVAARLKCP